jgi:serine/threonine protein kinase/Tol biopolymer transport system component
MIGQTLDQYRIEAKLGEGGMGIVYRARDTRLNRAVAIKMLPPERVADPNRKLRFVQEAKAASALNHPNIITIHDIRSASDVDFIVMEFVEGRTLEDLISPKGISARRVLRYGIQAADALAKAHGAGIVHRDLKPSNIMVTPEDRLKILDFGLAKLLEPSETTPEGTTLTARPRTEEGAVMGTAAYMSPEQVEGRDLDARSDIFSLGSVLYEMVTGKRPFTGESRLSLLTNIVNQDPKRPGELVASVSADLEGVILRCLRKDPSRRWQTASDLKAALEDADAESISGKQVRAPSHRRWIGAALPLVLIAGGYFVWQASRGGGNEEPLRAVALTTLPGVERNPSFSPTGDHVAFSWNGPKQDNRDIYVQQIGSGAPLRLTADPHEDQMPVWSPDGRWIAFLRNSPGKFELRLVPPLGGPERKLAEITIREFHNQSTFLDWCPESNCLLVTDSPGIGKPDALFAVSMETGEKRQLTNPQPPVYGDASPAVSHDGRELIFLRDLAPYSSEVFHLSLGKGGSAPGEARRIPVGNLYPRYPVWTADDKEILFSHGGLWRLPISRSGRPSRIPFVGEDGLMAALSRAQPGRASRLAYVRSQTDMNLWQVVTPAPGVPAAAAPSVAISSTVLDNNPQFSPDGGRVAFCSNRTGPLEIWLADPDGSNAVQLTNLGATLSCDPRWSPDGQWITFASNREGQQEINVIAAAGGKSRRLTSHPATDFIPSFSRNGQWIYFGSNRSGRNEIWKVPASGGEPEQITQDGGRAAFESIDGTQLYYLGGVSIRRMPVSGGKSVKILDGVVSNAFTVLETGIYYLDSVSGETRLQFYAFASGKSVVVARNLGPVFFGLAASPDGRTILYSRIDVSVDDLMLVENFR